MEFVVCALTIVILILLYNKRKSSKELERTRNAYLRQIGEQQEELISVQKKHNLAKVKLSEQEEEIANLKRKLTETYQELEFYRNIEEDSGKLNVKTDRDEHKQLIEQAARQIRKAKTNNLPTVKDEDADEPRGKMLLDEEQRLTCDKMEWSGGNFFVTGKAGTGKSFLLDVFRRITCKSHIVLAPTGIAALNVSGATLHSAFGYYNLVNLDVDQITIDTIRLKSEKRLLLRNVSTIIIDEISMVSADTFEKIDRILKALNYSNLPFGGKQILLFGDLFQLPPVVKAGQYEYLMDKYGGIYFFCSHAYKKGNFRFVELTINHRQKDDAEYFSLLNRIRDGSATSADIQLLNSRVSQDTSIYDRYTALLPTKAEVEKINQLRIDQLKTDSFTYQAKVVLEKYPNKNHSLENIFPIAQSLCLKKGTLVMMVANDPEHRWVNGTLGIVSNLSDKSISVAINKRVYDIHPTEFTEQEITYENGEIRYEDVLKVAQYPIVPAYAITIHKSQGQTYQNIVCDIDRCFASGQAYVALSRCESLEGLHLRRPISGASIRIDKTVLDFYQNSVKKEKMQIEKEKTLDESMIALENSEIDL